MNKSTQPLPLHWDYPRISPNLPSRIMCVVGGLYCVYEDFDISWFLYKMGNHEICWNINHVLGPPTYRHFLPLRNVTNEGKWVFVTDLHFVIFFSCLLQGKLGIGNCWRVDGNVGWLRDINIFRDFLSCITNSLIMTVSHSQNLFPFFFPPAPIVPVVTGTTIMCTVTQGCFFLSAKADFLKVF